MFRRAFRIGGRARVAREVDDELAFHLEMRTRQLLASGMPLDDAQREALRQFGDLAHVRDGCVTLDQERERAMRRANLLDEIRRDIVFAFRMLRRNAGFSFVVVLTLALGIGANTAIFTLVDAVLLRRLPVADPGELVAIGDPARTSSLSMGSPRGDLASFPTYRAIAKDSPLVTGLFASGRAGRLDVSFGGVGAELEHPRGRFVSGNYFTVLGVAAQMGRVFDGSEDDAIGSSPIAVISFGYWARRFHADPAAIGRTISVSGTGLTIVGVTPRGFEGDIVGVSNDMWIPLTMQGVLMPHERLLDDRSASWLLLMGRLAPGVTLEQARAGFQTRIRQDLVDNTPADDQSAARSTVIPVSSGSRGFSRVRDTYAVPLYTLMAGVGLLLLIICGNVANLLLARAIARQREMSVRLAIGAERWRLVRQLLTENLMLALCGAGAGLAVAWYGSQLLLRLAADGGTPMPLAVRLDLPVLAYTAGLSVVAAVLFGLVPALRASRVDLASTMRAHARSVAGGHGRVPIGRLLIAGQVALSLVLLVGAGLLVRSLMSVERSNTGLDRDHLLIVDADIAGRGYQGERKAVLARSLMQRFAAIPGVAAVSYSENGIFSGTESGTVIHVPGYVAPGGGDSIDASYDRIGPGYVTALGGRLLAGRDIAASDGPHAAGVVLLNETMARQLFARGSAVGRTLRLDDTTNAEVVGVIADVKDHELVGEPVPRFYRAYFQQDDPAAMRFIVRTAGDPNAVKNQVRREILAADGLLVIDDLDPLSTLMRQSLREARLVARLASGFGVLALLLAAIGLYGVMTYAITQRTGEIGLRVALGAQRGDVIGMILLDALKVVAIGLIVGVPLALGLTRLLQSQLHGVSAADPVAVVVALSVLAISAAVAALLPALRASRVTPLVALQQD